MLGLDRAENVRTAATALGGFVTAFGLLPVVAPARFANVFGIPTNGDPAVVSAIRSTGVRDVVMGMGLVSASLHGSPLAPHLLSRMLVDGGDILAVALGLRGGAGRSMLALGGMALAATVMDTVVWRAAKQTAGDDDFDAELDAFLPAE